MDRDNDIDMQTTEVAVLLDDYVDKYNPGIQTFKLQSVVGLQENSRAVTTQYNNVPNLMNKDKDIGLTRVKKAPVIKLELPREICRNFPTKYIPVGTRFIVSFNSSDITKPVIIGREYD